MDQTDRQAKIDFILEHYENPYRYGALENPTVVQKGGNPGCGDIVTFYLKTDADGRITDISFEGEGCTISMAGSSLVTEMIEGKTLDEAAKLSPEMVLDQLGHELVSTRLKCATLGLNTAKAAIRKLRGEAGGES